MWVFGGRTTEEECAAINANVWRYDLCSGSWTSFADAPMIAREEHVAWLGGPTGESMYVYGGAYDFGKYLMDVWRFDLDKKKWDDSPCVSRDFIPGR